MNGDSKARGVSDVFKAYPVSVFEFLAKTGQGLYVPAYQRPYSWGKQNINRLVEDISHGFRMLTSQSDTVTFLGTIIAIHDTQHKTVSPVVEGQVPSRVMTIIDGQQRLSTLLLLIVRLHQRLSTLVSKLNVSEVADEWLNDEVQRQLAELQKSFEEDQGHGHLDYRFYPRMIRSYIDQWSKKDNAKYHSPLSRYLHLYGAYLRSNDKNKPFAYTFPSGLENSAREPYETFEDRIRCIEQAVKVVEVGPKNEEDRIEIPDWGTVLAHQAFQQTLCYQAKFPDEVVDLIPRPEGQFHRLFRLHLFSRFVLTRVALTVVEATNEDSAFDLFEALNTTGEPLTAYETFKPKVIQREQPESFSSSRAFQRLAEIDEYLAGFNKTEDKQEATRNLVVAFALAEDGTKLSRHLSDQRRYLRDRYESATNDEKDSFLDHLAVTVSYIDSFWPSSDSISENLKVQLAHSTLVALDFLRTSNHSITAGVLTRFYAPLKDALDKADSVQISNSKVAFENAVKAVAAFWALWRSSRPGTEGIDSYYRQLMLSSQSNTDAEAPRFIGLARKPGKGRPQPPDVDLLKKALLFVLAEKGRVSNFSQWAALMLKQNAYKTKAVTRFILLMAFHNSPSDSSEPGLNMKGVDGSVDLLNPSCWKNLHTIEHIAPEKPDSTDNDWDTRIYTQIESDAVNSIGNLTLLPQSVNASVSNRSWRSKKFMYKILSTPGEADKNALISQCADYQLTPPTSELLQKRTTYMAQLDALARVQDDWTLELIGQRGQRIAQLAWDKLFEWLKVEADSREPT